jgi:ABC-2 type transport system ATP-binding protein
MIKIQNLSRAYGDFLAVDNVGFTIDKGEIVGLLGHNGAGKTTIMKMLSGYLEPSSGFIEIDGLDMADARAKIQQRLGYLPEALPIYPEMSVADYLDYAANLKGLAGKQAEEEIRRVIQATNIQSKLLAPIGTLSRGFKQRVGVAQAILGRPKLLILDEPTNGLDPTQTQQMRALIRELAKEATVILSTHIMQEVDALCDRALIMRAGKMVVDAKLEELRRSNQLTVITDLAPETGKTLLQNTAGVAQVQAQTIGFGYRYQLSLNEEDGAHTINNTANAIAKQILDSGHALYELRREQRDLESVFREVNEKEELAHAA